ncbi:MAG TPA: Rieske (2Fe-2S) protein [Thermaerobacter sp.]
MADEREERRAESPDAANPVPPEAKAGEAGQPGSSQPAPAAGQAGQAPKVDPEKLAAAKAAAAQKAAARAAAQGPAAGKAPAAKAAAAKAAAAKAGAAAGGGAGKQEAVTRRDFLHWALWGSALLWLGQFAGSFANYFWPRKTGFFGQKINIGPVSNYPVGSVTKVDAGKFYLVHTEQGLIALYWRCTHLGCTVPWKPEERPDAGGCFCCPCHGSQFDKVGEKIGGPAPRPLDYFPIEIDQNGNIWVDTGRPQQRASFSPDQLTPVS